MGEQENGRTGALVIPSAARNLGSSDGPYEFY